MRFPLDGGCRCNATRIRVTERPLVTMACHCSGCQRMSSSAFSLTAIFPSHAFEVTKGTPVVGGLRGEDTQHMFCPHCLTWMFTRPVPMPHIVNVRPTMFDDHAWFAPFVESFVENRLPWAQTGAVHSFDEFPPIESYEALMREFAGWSAASK